MDVQISHDITAQSAGAVEYTNCISVDPPNECLGYDAKQFDGEVPVMLWEICVKIIRDFN